MRRTQHLARPGLSDRAGASEGVGRRPRPTPQNLVWQLHARHVIRLYRRIMRTITSGWCP